MVAARRVLITGSGNAAISLANKLRILNNPRELDITVVGNEVRHFCRADGTLVALGMKNYRKSVKDIEFLLNNDIEFVRDEVTGVFPEHRMITTRSGKKFDYDILVIATGSSFRTELLPGYDGEAKHFYDLQHALELSKALEDFTGGKIVVGLSEPPVQCPMAIHEFVLLLQEQLKDAGKLEGSEIHFVYPQGGVFPDSGISSMFTGMFSERGITVHSDFTVKEISQKNKEVVSESGEKINYNLLVLSPPTRGQNYLAESGLTDELGYVKVNKNTLQAENVDDVFAIGDSTSPEVPRSEYSVLLQVRYLAKRLTAQINHMAFSGDYDGGSACTALVNSCEGITISFNYDRAPKVPVPSQGDYRFKLYYSDTYFSTILRGMM